MMYATPEPNGNFYNDWLVTLRRNLMRMVKFETDDGFEARPSDKNIEIAVLDV